MTVVSYTARRLSELAFGADKSVVMTSARFGVQAAIVLSLVVFVSWPESARVKGATSAWRSDGREAAGAGRRAAERLARGLKHEIGYGSISVRRASATGATALQRKLYEQNPEARRRRTPDSVLLLGGRLNAIVGQARTALSAPVPFARLVLRNAATGMVEARATADDKGQFTFIDVIPSGYVIELLGADSSVAATSELVTVDIGELREATVRLPGGRLQLAAFGTVAPTAHEPIAVAAQQGINAVTPPDRSVSPQR
jgi:hypothetical protein